MSAFIAHSTILSLSSNRFVHDSYRSAQLRSDGLDDMSRCLALRGQAPSSVTFRDAARRSVLHSA